MRHNLLSWPPAGIILTHYHAGDAHEIFRGGSTLFRECFFIGPMPCHCLSLKLVDFVAVADVDVVESIDERLLRANSLTFAF